MDLDRKVWDQKLQALTGSWHHKRRHAEQPSGRGQIPVWRKLQNDPLRTSAQIDHVSVVIVGAGPVGLALAVDLGLKGHKVTVLGSHDFVSAGSKAICFSKRSLDILDRLGVGEAAVRKGVDWNLGKVFWKGGAEPIYQFDMLPVKNQKMPGFINLSAILHGRSADRTSF